MKDHHMALDPSTEAKLGELTDAITSETQEIKDMISAGSNPAEINARLDGVISAVKGISDNLTTPPTV